MKTAMTFWPLFVRLAVRLAGWLARSYDISFPPVRSLALSPLYLGDVRLARPLAHSLPELPFHTCPNNYPREETFSKELQSAEPSRAAPRTDERSPRRDVSYNFRLALLRTRWRPLLKSCPGRKGGKVNRVEPEYWITLQRGSPPPFPPSFPPPPRVRVPPSLSR